MTKRVFLHPQSLPSRKNGCGVEGGRRSLYPGGVDTRESWESGTSGDWGGQWLRDTVVHLWVGEIRWWALGGDARRNVVNSGSKLWKTTKGGLKDSNKRRSVRGAMREELEELLETKGWRIVDVRGGLGTGCGGRKWMRVWRSDCEPGGGGGLGERSSRKTLEKDWRVWEELGTETNGGHREEVLNRYVRAGDERSVGVTTTSEDDEQRAKTKATNAIVKDGNKERRTGGSLLM